MQKIMFNDRFCLTEAVLERRKRQTRRFISKEVFTLQWSFSGTLDNPKEIYLEDEYGNFLDIRDTRYSKYKVGEVVAIAQNYKDAGIHFEDLAKDADMLSIKSKVKGFSNKMFVKPKLMPHQIKITNVRVQRLQEITDEECLLEGVREVEVSYNWGNSATHTMYSIIYYDHKGLTKELRGRTPKEVYAILIDKIHGKGTWENNPYVLTFDFELIK